MLWVIIIGFMIISMIVGNRLKNKMKKYSEIPTTSGMSGAEISQRMLQDNRIYDVQITAVPGQLTDHYNPQNKTINLSQDVYHGRNVTAAAVAAHETGHAVQHAQAYAFLKFRSAMVPITNLSSRLMNVIFMISIFGGFMAFMNWQMALMIMVVAQGVVALFSLVTLPVEFDASNRALHWLKTQGIAQGKEFEFAQDGLKWAAMTYVVAALASISTLLYYVGMLSGSDD